MDVYGSLETLMSSSIAHLLNDRRPIIKQAFWNQYSLANTGIPVVSGIAGGMVLPTMDRVAK
jgi:hypothetical protein